jgi:hypothetical protein
MDTPTLPANAHSVSGFYVSADAQSKPNWVTNMKFLDPSYNYPSYNLHDPIPGEATNIPQEWVKKLKIFRSAKCRLADFYGITLPKEFGGALKTMEQVNLDHFES